MSNRTTFDRWFADGTTWVGVYECKDLSSQRLGDRVAMPFDTADLSKAEVGDKAPDHPTNGPGWRWSLIAKCNTVEEALAYFPDPN